MLDKKDTETTSTTSTSINTEEVSVNVIKVNGSDLPVEYSTGNGGFSLPHFETFQDKRQKKNVTINVRTFP